MPTSKESWTPNSIKWKTNQELKTDNDKLNSIRRLPFRLLSMSYGWYEWKILPSSSIIYLHDCNTFYQDIPRNQLMCTDYYRSVIIIHNWR